MSNILTQVAESHHSRFMPSSPDDYFVLRLARGLDEPEAAQHYAVLASQYSEQKLLCAYRHALSKNHRNPARVFHEYLRSLPPNGKNGSFRARLLAVRLERRAVAVAVFSGTHVIGWRVRQLSSDQRKAEATLAGFIRSMLGEHDCQSVAMENTMADTLRDTLKTTVMEQCRDMCISVWEISRDSVLKSLAHPAPANREEVRQLMTRLWPIPGLKSSEQCVLDALAMGLYVQTERIFAADH